MTASGHAVIGAHMHPILLKFGGLTIHWYGVFMALAFLAGYANWTWVGRREGRDATFCSDLLFVVMIGGIVGGRVAYVLANVTYYANAPVHVLYIWEGGLIYYGGFVGAVVGVYLFARRHGVAILDLLDFGVTSLPIAHAIGRLGCFMNGCCYGSPAGGWPGVRFPPESMPWVRQCDLGLIGPGSPESLPVHPVQLYEAAWNLGVFVLVSIVFRRRRHAGQTLGVYLLAYPLGRLVLEGLRGTERLHVGYLSLAQGISLALMAGGALLLRGRRRAHC